VGWHRLVDSERKPGAICTYKQTDGSYWEGRLKHINVRPPKMRAIAGWQEVGWRFVIERQGYGPWKTIYRSPIQRASTNSTTNARYSWLGVNVRVPTASSDQEPWYVYRVAVVMFWFGPSGSTEGKVRDRVAWYRWIDLFEESSTGVCEGWSVWIPN
jgi:hypothetical protein